MQSLLSFFLLTTLFLVPLIPALFGFGYEAIKVLVFLALAITSGFIFSYLLARKKIKIRWTKLKIISLLFFLSLTLSSLFGIHPFESLVGKYPYYQGLILYWFLFLYFLMVSEIKIKLKIVSWFIVASALIVAVLAVVQFIALHIFNYQLPTYAGRIVSTFGQPNLYSGFLLLALPFALQLKKQKYWLIGLISLGILASLSKAAVVLLFSFIIVISFKSLKHKGLIIFCLAVFFLNVIVFSLDKSSGLLWNEILKPLSQTGVENHQVERRIYIYPVLIEEYFKSPLLGFGVDSINTRYQEHFADFKPELKNYPPLYFNLMNLNIDRSHNYFLDLLIFSGVGLVFYGWLLLALFKSNSPGYLKTFLVLYLIWVFFQVQSIVHLMLFWLTAGIISSGQSFTEKKLKKNH